MNGERPVEETMAFQETGPNSGAKLDGSPRSKERQSRREAKIKIERPSAFRVGGRRRISLFYLCSSGSWSVEMVQSGAQSATQEAGGEMKKSEDKGMWCIQRTRSKKRGGANLQRECVEVK